MNGTDFSKDAFCNKARTAGMFRGYCAKAGGAKLVLWKNPANQFIRLHIAIVEDRICATSI